MKPKKAFRKKYNKKKREAYHSKKRGKVVELDERVEAVRNHQGVRDDSR